MSADRILTTHVGSLPRPKELIEANNRRAKGQIDDAEFARVLEESAKRVVAKQLEIGIDVVNEGEYGHLMNAEIDYGAWWSYVFTRLSGLEVIDSERHAAALAKQPTDKVVLDEFMERRDFQAFPAVYAESDAGENFNKEEGDVTEFPAVTGPVEYIGGEEVARDTALLRAGLDAAGSDNAGFLAAVSPGSAVRLTNEYYEDQDAAVLAAAKPMGQEYKAITDAGFTVQLDAPDLAESWDQINPEPRLDDYLEFLRVRIEAINTAIEGLPREQTLLHVCWGSWHGPHSTDIPFADIVDVILEAKVGGLSFESAGPRHAHEWRIWQNRELPEGLKLYPGVISHNTNALEHPRLIADRIIRFADLVGPENVVASADCGLGGRIHRDIAWAKLGNLVAGAKLASEELF
ncbi:epoxyalkane--coenzyme M transferase [Corynebacterium halotolerans]|uniref:Epoxyalkane:coenzyme M transferase n=1 Tax=Corynebacterium halotolerans YIM 70093 = DSM 44683 TaxID=1121362 RepID=M1NND0_9CORY|nr:epoxyalkane--coenzyme M transferase [Corynebacterium halotolerans]AGF72868.1 epoxyalkane:coenzyme M transferase [Corynebacterium halotolerans YIM 70093 = DSM 44683]